MTHLTKASFSALLLLSISFQNTEASSIDLIPLTPGGNVQLFQSQSARGASLGKYTDLNIVGFFNRIFGLIPNFATNLTAQQQKTFAIDFKDVMAEVMKLKDLKSVLNPADLRTILSNLKEAYMRLFMAFGHSVMNAQTGKDEVVPGVLQLNQQLKDKLITNMGILDNILSNRGGDIASLVDISMETITFAQAGALEPLQTLSGQSKDINASIDSFMNTKNSQIFDTLLSHLMNGNELTATKASLQQMPKAWYDLLQKLINSFGLRMYYVNPKPDQQTANSLERQQSLFIRERDKYNTASKSGSLAVFMQTPFDLNMTTLPPKQQGQRRGGGRNSFGGGGMSPQNNSSQNNTNMNASSLGTVPSNSGSVPSQGTSPQNNSTRNNANMAGPNSPGTMPSNSGSVPSQGTSPQNNSMMQGGANMTGPNSPGAMPSNNSGSAASSLPRGFVTK